MDTELDNLGKVIKTDVLILGSGATGCCASVAASRQGARVLMVDKGKLEGSGSLAGGNDHFMANLNTGPDWDTDEAVVKFYNNTLRYKGSTNIIDKRWVKVMPIIIKLMEDSGIEFVRNPDGSYYRTVGFSQPGTWWINIKDGQFMKKRLAKKLRSMDVDVLDHVMITKLLKADGRIAGAVGFNVLDGTFYVLRGKTIVLALGQYVSRATTNSTGMPFNVMQYPYNTGSNCVLAYNAGAKIMNLELMELATLLPKGFGAGGMNGINSMGGHETDAYGNRFIGKYSPVFMENCNRQIMIKGTYQEQIEGKGPPFYMDMRHLSKEDVDHLQNVLMVGDKATYNDYLEQRGIGFATHPMEVEFSEFAYGGVLVANERLESTIDGLFSGCHFQSLSGAMCGGYSAGAEAAKAALKVKALADINATEAANEKERIFQPMKIHGGLSYKDFEGTIRQVMNYYVGYVRNEKGLEIALKSLKLIESRTNELTAADLHELMRANEAKHLIRHCQLSSQAALIRRESGRTFYWRSDYPDLNEEMEKNIVLWQENGEPKSALVSPSQLYGRS